MCQVLVTYNCGHTSRKKVLCDRSRGKGGIGNFLKYAFLEKPCDYDTPKRRHRLCTACESHLDGLRDYETSRDLHRGEHRGRRSRDDRESRSDRSHGHREHRHRDKSSDNHCSSKGSRKESHSSRSSRRRNKKSSREESRGRSTRSRGPMATIDETAPLPSQHGNGYTGKVADVPPHDESGSALRDDGSSVNDFREFIRAAERAEAEQKGPRGFPSLSEPASPLSDEVLDDLKEFPRPPSSAYVPARANWKPQLVPPQQSTNHPPPRPSSSVYSQPSRAASSSRRSRQTPKKDSSPPHPSSSAYSLPSWKTASSRHSHQAPKRDSTPPPVPAIPAKYAGSQVSSQVSWVTDYVNDDEENDSSAQSTLPTSNGTTPRKSVDPPPRPTFEVDPWTQDPLDRLAKKWVNEAREKMKEQESTSDLGNGLRDSVQVEGSAPAPYGGELSQTGQPANTNQAQVDKSKPMMHFTCYRDPNNPKPPPAPTRSSTGSQAYMNPPEVPAPPDPVGGLPQPNPGFNAHRLKRQSIDNISHVTRWSDLCPPDVNSNIKVKANAGIKATHNGKPVHVVNPNIIKRSWGNAEGPSAGKISQRNSSGKNSSSNVKKWFSKLRAQPSEVSFGCVDVKKHDSLNSQKRPDSKRSNRSSNSKGKKKS